MNTMFFKLQQVKKSGDSATIKLPEFKSEDLVKAEQIAKEMLEHIILGLELQAQKGQKNIKIGGVTFSLGSRFVLYLNVNGLDYSLDDCFKLAVNQDQETSTFRRGDTLFVQMYQIIRMVQGQTQGLTQEAKKVLTKSNPQNLLN